MRHLSARPAAAAAAATFRTAGASMSAPVPLYYNDIYHVDLPKTSSFPMQKYRYVREALQRELPSTLATFYESPLVSEKDLTLVHCEGYVSRFLGGQLTRDELRRIGFPWSPQHVNRALSSTGGTVAAAHAVCRADATAIFAGHIAGGTHHAFADRGEGYCVFNDIAVAAAVALRDHAARVQRVLVVDCDVHQGNGTASIFAGDERVFTASFHCEANLFSAREVSDLDVDLPPGVGDEAYLEALQAHLPGLFERVRPQLCFFQAGVDVHESDRIGKLKLSSAGIKKRNALVYAAAARHGARLVVTMGGGYPKDLDEGSVHFHRVVQSHMDCYRQCASAHARLSRPGSPEA